MNTSILMQQNPSRVLLLALVYFVAGKLGLLLSDYTYIALIWLPSGIAVAALLRWGYICWPGVFLGALLVNYSVNANVALSFSIATGNTLGPLFTVWLLRWWQFHPALDRGRDAIFLALATTIGMMLTASAGVYNLARFGVIEAANSIHAGLIWWSADFFGVLLAAPLLLTVSRTNLTQLCQRGAEFVAWLLVAGGISCGIFFYNNDVAGYSLPLVFLELPVVIWSAMRFGLLGSSFGTLMLATIAALATNRGLGPFMQPYMAEEDYGLILLGLFFDTLVTGSLTVYLLQSKYERQRKALYESSVHLSHMVATSSTMLFSMRVVGEQLHTEWVSDNLGRLLGYSQNEVMQPDWWLKHLHPKDRGRVLAASARLFNGEPVACDYRFMHKDGREVWIHDEQKLVCDALGAPIEVVSSWSDITGHKMVELELRVAAITFDSQEGILITDANQVILRVNNAFTRLTGYSAEEAIGKTPVILKSGRQDAEFYQAMWHAINHDEYWQGEIWNRRKNGEMYPEWLTITAIKDDDGNITNYIATFSDITELKEAEECIRNLAFYDPLTKLPNRRLLLDRLNLALAGSARSRQHGALLFLDLDRFKQLNDAHGHDMGDLLLLAVAQRLQSIVREGDTVARLGGDEFVVMLGSLDEYITEAAAQAQLLAEKIRVALVEPYQLSMSANENKTPFVYHSSASIGVVLFMGHEDSVEELMKRADLAMYEAKHAGRDAICIFDPAMQAALNARATLEAHMHEALAQQYRLYYQMQVDEQGNIVGAEALIRWQHPERGLLLPAEFIPLAEENGLIVPIGKWVLQTACAQLKAWGSDPQTRDLKLAVNVSAYQFRQTNFVTLMRSVLEQTGARAERLELEITESLILYDIEDTIAKMRQLKEIGVRFAMDDFGTGYSSLSNLQRLPLDQLKIDQTFIRNMVEDANDAAIVNAILTMGKSLGMEVVAEGVETEAQRDYLVQHGCPTCQGFLFGEPVSLKEFEARLREG